MPVDISVQVCTYNRKNIVVKCLKALARQDYPGDKFEVALVDDGSTDGTRQAVESLELPFYLNYRYQENAGPAAARNAGVKIVRGKYVLFLDDDIIASPQLISEHLKTHKEYPDSVVRGPVKHVNCFKNLERFKNQFKLQDISTAFFLTGNSSVEKRYIEKVGMFEESFREYGYEDLEMGLRLRNLGLKMRFNNSAIGYHYKTTWRKSDLPSLIRQARAKAKNAVYFLKKHPVWRVKLATGIYPGRLFLNEMMDLAGLGRNFCYQMVNNHPGEVLTGIPLFCARMLYKLEYYKTIKTDLSQMKKNGSRTQSQSTFKS